MKKNLFLFFLPVLFLVACSTTPSQCDPANANIGIMDKLSCQFSGNYQTRIDQKKIVLENEQKTNEQFKEIYKLIEKQKNDTSLSVKQRQAEQQKLAKELQSLNDELKSKAQNQSSLQEQLNNIDQQLKTINQPNTSELEKQSQLDNLNKKLQQLQKALNL